MPPVPCKDPDAVLVPSKESAEVSTSTMKASVSQKTSQKIPPNFVPFINIPLLELSKALLLAGLAALIFHQLGLFEQNHYYYWMAVYAVVQLVDMISPATGNLLQYIYPPVLVAYNVAYLNFRPTYTEAFAFMPTILFLIGVPMSVCLHRYFAHAAFTTTRLGQFVVGLVSTFAYQGGCLWWAGKHVRHHHHCDQPKDPHSVVQQGFAYAFCGWTMNPINLKERDLKFVEARLQVPELFFLDKFYLLPVAITFTALEQVLGYERPFIAYSILLPMLLCRLITLLFNVEYHPADNVKRCKSVDNPRLLALIVGESEHDLHHKMPAMSRRNDWDLACKFYHHDICVCVCVSCAYICCANHIIIIIIDLTSYCPFTDWISLSWMESLGLVWDLR